jgi:2-polyprenyl-3-methyl-5-hydroxy-6-metoxy-1,4-benzoquinol methylase
VRITEEYRAQQLDLHKNPAYGASSNQFVNIVRFTAEKFGAESILDYGCGKGTMADHIPHVRLYDPCVEKFSTEPSPAEMVCCTDVLEHVEPECLDAVLDHMQALAKKVVVATVASYPAQKTLADGRNAHLIQKPLRWWADKFFDRWDVQLIRVTRNMPDGKGFCVIGLANGDHN